MQWPSITGGYLAVLALVYAALAINVVRLRRQNLAAFGDAGNPALRSAIRAHGHFAEYVPIIVLMVAMLEMSGMAAWRVHLLMGALLISRLLHPFGMYAKLYHHRDQFIVIDDVDCLYAEKSGIRLLKCLCPESQ